MGYRRGIKFPGKPVENAFAESFNGLRDECLNINWFMSIKHAREASRAGDRTTIPLKGRSPKEYAEAVAALY